MVKRIFYLTAAIFVVSASLTFALGRKSANPRISATLSDQDRPTKKPSGVSAEEEQQVRKMLTDRREAFNRHDVKTGCSYFADDADFVNVAGSWWRGRQEIEKNMTELYAGMFKNIHFNDSEISNPLPHARSCRRAFQVGGNGNRRTGRVSSPSQARHRDYFSGERKWEMAG